MIEIIPNFHPVFVHFTVALLTVGIGFYCLGMLARGSKWHLPWMTVARWNLWLGAGFALVTAVLGWRAFNTVTHDTPSHYAMLEHRAWALATLAVVSPLALWSIWNHRRDRDLNWIFIALLLIAQGMLLSTAWHGGELVYRYGLGVMSLPKVETHRHDDGHDPAARSHQGATALPSLAPGEDHATGAERHPAGDAGHEHPHEHGHDHAH